MASNQNFTTPVVGYRLIGRVPIACEYCAANLPRSNIEAHKRRCEKRPLRCVTPGCAFESVDREAFAMHVAKEHREQLIEHHGRLFAAAGEQKAAEVQVRANLNLVLKFQFLRGTHLLRLMKYIYTSITLIEKI